MYIVLCIIGFGIIGCWLAIIINCFRPKEDPALKALRDVWGIVSDIREGNSDKAEEKFRSLHR